MLTITGINLVSDNEGKQLSIFDIDDNSKKLNGRKLSKRPMKYDIDTARALFLWVPTYVKRTMKYDKLD